jgi:hypothetical protein
MTHNIDMYTSSATTSDAPTAMRTQFKYYKRRQPPPSFEDVVEFGGKFVIAKKK